MSRLYLSRNGQIGISTSAIELMDLQTGNDSYLGLIQDFAENSFYIYASTPTATKFKRKVNFEKTNKLWYITIKRTLMEKIFGENDTKYISAKLEEEPYNIEGIECYKILTE